MSDPYYQTALATLYLGDARDVLPTLGRESVDLIATDPPYGVKWRSGLRGEKFDEMAGDDNSLNVPELLAGAVRALRVNRHVYVFGYSPEDLAGPLCLGGVAELIWDKTQLGPGDLALPYGPAHERITFGVYAPRPSMRRKGCGNLSARLRKGSVLRVPRLNSQGVKNHPTEKPVALMRQIIESSSMLGEVVLDPFAGSGSTLVAALITGRKAIGIEVNEQYAEITVKRLLVAERLAQDMTTL